MNRKQLISKINMYEKKLRPLRNKLSKIQHRELTLDRKTRIGKCYQYKNNYSCPQDESDYWFLYVKVVGVDDIGFIVVEFETDKYGMITMRYRTGVPEILFQEEIAKKVFDTEFRKIMARLHKLGD